MSSNMKVVRNLEEKSQEMIEKIKMKFSSIDQSLNIDKKKGESPLPIFQKPHIALIGKSIEQPLRKVTISGYQLEDDAIIQITQAKWAQVQELNLSCNKMTKVGVQAIASANWVNLRLINLSDNIIGNQGLKILLEAKLSRLDSLNIGKNQITEDGIKCLQNGEWPKMTSLNFGNNRIGKVGLSSLMKCNWPNLRNLLLQNAKLVDSIYQFNYWKSLRQIHLSGNRLGNRFAKYFCQSNWEQLSIVDLANNCLTDNGIIQISKANWIKKSLLRLSKNSISDRGFKYFIDVWTLQKGSFIIQFNDTSKQSLKRVVKLKNSPTIKISLKKCTCIYACTHFSVLKSYIRQKLGIWIIVIFQ